MTCLLVGVLLRSTQDIHKIPYTVVLLIVGIVMGSLDRFANLGALGDSAKQWANLSPEKLLFLFIPALIFGSAASVDFHVFSRQIPQMLLLAVPGVVVAAVLTATFSVFAFDYDFSFAEGMAFGSMLAATDPIAVVALAKQLGVSTQLSLLIEGESLFNDGSAFVLFLVFRESMRGESLSAGEAIGFFSRLAFGGPVLGLLAGLVVIFLLKKMEFDIVSQTTVTVLAAYGVFYVAEATPLHVSSVLAVVILGLTMASGGKTAIKEHETLHTFWEMVDYFANTLVFALSGFVILQRGLANGDIRAIDFGYLLLLYLVLHVIRALSILLLRPFMTQIAYGISLKETALLSYSGLRGAVGLILALIIDDDTRIDSKTGARFLFHSAGIAALTLLINGTTVGHLIRLLGLSSQTTARRKVFESAVKHIHQKQEEGMGSFKHHEFYFDADWTQIRKIFDDFVKSLENSQESSSTSQSTRWHHVFCGKLISPFCRPLIRCCRDFGNSPGMDDVAADKSMRLITRKCAENLRRTSSLTELPDSEFFEESRQRFYDLLKSQYWEMYENGSLHRTSFSQLHEAAASAQDRTHLPIHDWSYLTRFFEPSKFRELLSRFLGCGAEKVLFSSLSFEFDLAAGFVSAHRAVEILFKEIVENRPVRDIVLSENKNVVREAQKKVDDMQESFGEITRAIKTKHIVHCLLQESEHSSKELLRHGEIDSKEFDLIKHKVELTWKGLQLPTHCVADERTMLREVGYLSALNSRTFEYLYRVSRRMVFKQNEILYSEGEQCRGCYIILRGTVCLRRDILDDHDSAEDTSNAVGAEYHSGKDAVGRYTLNDEEESDTISIGGRSKSGISVREKLSSAANFIHEITRRHSDASGFVSHEGLGDLVETTEVVDRVMKGSVIGLLSMLTGQPTIVTAITETPVVAVYLSARDIFPLLKSAPDPSGGPIRQVQPLEEALCRMAAVLIAETKLSQFSQLRPAQIRQVLSEAHLIRPEAKRPVLLGEKAILLTGAIIEPKDEGKVKSLLDDTNRIDAKRLRESDFQLPQINYEFDEQSNNAATERMSCFPLTVGNCKGQLSVSTLDKLREDALEEAFDPYYHRHKREAFCESAKIPDAEFILKKRAFAFVDKSHEELWFSAGTRLLMIPSHFAAMFDSAHSRIMESIQLHRHLNRLTKVETPSATTPVGNGSTNNFSAKQLSVVSQSSVARVDQRHSSVGTQKNGMIGKSQNITVNLGHRYRRLRQRTYSADDISLAAFPKVSINHKGKKVLSATLDLGKTDSHSAAIVQLDKNVGWGDWMVRRCQTVISPTRITAETNPVWFSLVRESWSHSISNGDLISSQVAQVRRRGYSTGMLLSRKPNANISADSLRANSISPGQQDRQRTGWYHPTRIQNRENNGRYHQSSSQYATKPTGDVRNANDLRALALANSRRHRRVGAAKGSDYPQNWSNDESPHPDHVVIDCFRADSSISGYSSS